MPENKYDISDLLRYGAEQNPVDFKGAFDALLQDRVRDVVTGKKMEIAATLFADAPKEEEEDGDISGEGEDQEEAA